MKKRNTLKTWNFPKNTFKVFLLIVTILYIQLCYLTLSPSLYGINMKTFAANRNMYSEDLIAHRGTIYDINGDVLAQNVASYTVIAYLSKSRGNDYVKDKQKTATSLSKILNMKKSYLLELLSRDVYQVELGPGGRGITELKKDEIENLNLPGIDFVEGTKRNYPNGDFASYIVGYAKENDEGNLVGEMGIESKYDELLKGTNGFVQYQQDRYGYKIPDTKETRIEPNNGNKIYLTIDSNVQRFVESAVKDVKDEYNPEWFMITAMDAKTGDILGTGSIPSFDPNIKNITNYENPLISLSFEPGSTMKTFTYMCAIEKGTYKGNQKYASGSINVGGFTINDWNRDGWGRITYDKGFEYSSNVAATNIVSKFINKNDLKECLKKYGFGKQTGIELSREAKGNINFNYESEVATASFGQGINVTAIQLLQAASLISNNGKMLKPHIVDKIISDDGELVYESNKEESEQIVSVDTVNKIKQLMDNVINGTDYGTTGGMYKMDGFDLIAKTGTAQIYDENTGVYQVGTNSYIYSFLGMFPKNEPEIIIYTAMKRPKYGQYQGMIKANKSVIESISKYKNIYGNAIYNSDIKTYELPSYFSKNTNNVVKDLKKKGIIPIVLGSGDKIINQNPSYGNKVLSHERVILLTNDVSIKMPDVEGWSRSDVITLCNLLGIKYEINGYGYVKSQSIEEGTIINPKHNLKVVLKQKYKASSN